MRSAGHEKSRRSRKYTVPEGPGDEADDTRKELEDVVREKNDLRRRVVEAEQSVLDLRRVLEARQKLEGQLSSEARVLSLEKDMAERRGAARSLTGAGAPPKRSSR